LNFHGQKFFARIAEVGAGSTIDIDKAEGFGVNHLNGIIGLVKQHAEELQ